MDRGLVVSSALLIIDMQVGLYLGAEKPYDGERVLANIQQLIRQTRERNMPKRCLRQGIEHRGCVSAKERSYTEVAGHKPAIFG